MALEGDLKDFSLSDIFRLLSDGSKTGTLFLVTDGAEGRVCFEDGRIFFASSDSNRESLGRRIVKTGVLGEESLREALDLQEAQSEEGVGRRLGRILVDEGYLEEDVLEGFVQEQINDTLFDLFRWEEGGLRFESGELCEEEDIGISLSVENIIMESSRRLELWDRIRQKIPDQETMFIMAPGPGDKSMEIHLEPKEWMLLRHLHVGRAVAELIELAGSTDFETMKILYGMHSAGLIDKVGVSGRDA